jgi:hypothetical protein
VEKRLRLGELGVRLSREAGDDVGCEVDPRVPPPGAIEESAKTDGRHSALHPAQDGIGTGLKGQVKVRSDDASGRDEVDKGFARFHRLERGEPDPARGRVGLEPLEESHEALSPAPERREVHPAEDDLGDALLAEGVDRLLDLGEGSAPLAPAERRDDAEGATPAATVLDLQERARTPRSRRPRQGRAKDLFGRNAESGDLPWEEPRRHFLYQADKGGRRTVPRDEIDLGTPRETVRVALGETSRHGEDCSRILPAEAPYLPEGVAVGALRDRAGVEDHDVGRLSGRNARKARTLENASQVIGLDLAHLATENMNGIASGGAP